MFFKPVTRLDCDRGALASHVDENAPRDHRLFPDKLLGYEFARIVE